MAGSSPAMTANKCMSIGQISARRLKEMKPAMTSTRSDIRARLGLRPIINVSGTMTALGASTVVPEAAKAVAAIPPEFVEINDLQRKASAVIARLTGGEAGCVTASASAGITIGVAAAITGSDLATIEQLPA